MKEKKDKPTRGGARPGAGRKSPPTKKRMNFTIDLDLAARLEGEVNKTEVVEQALRKHYRMS